MVKSPATGDMWPFILRTSRQAAIGLLIGTVLGFAFPSALLIAITLWDNGLEFAAAHLGQSLVWPDYGEGALFLALSIVILLCGIRLATLLRRISASWRAGLVSAVCIAWLLTSGVGFALLSVTGSYLSLALLGVALVATIVELRRDIKLSQNAEARSEADRDRPISKREEDTLGRGDVVDSITRAIVNDRAPVIAVTGSYGDGKTSVLNLLSSALSARNDVVCVRFSTWLPMDPRTLVSTFFGAALAEIETRLFIPNIKRGLVATTRLLFAVLPKVPAPLVDLIKKPSQEEQIAELRRNLARLPVRVVALLDDMDRMRKKELGVLLKLLRGVPEFPQFTYVCAFDRHSLAQILSRDNSNQSRREAENFLEKFFPEEIPLPKIESGRLSVEFEERFYAACDRNKVLTDPTDRQKFKDEIRSLWEVSLRGYFSNLRRVKLFTNRLSRSLPLVAHEVNLRDFVLLEMVRMTAPVLYEDIFRNAGYFMFPEWRLTTWLQVPGADDEEVQRRRTAYFNDLFKDLPRPPEGTTLSLLKEIFPSVRSYLAGTDIPSRIAEDQDRAQLERRIYHPDYFPRYFLFNVPSDLFGERELSDFIESMNRETDVAQCVATFKKKFTQLEDLPMKRWDFLRHVRYSVAKFNPISTQALALAIAELSDKLEQSTATGFFDEFTALRIVFEAANQLHETMGAQALLEKVIQYATSDSFATRILSECFPSTKRLLKYGIAIDKDEAEKAFRQRMVEKYRPGGDRSFFPADQKVNITPLGRWALCGTVGREQVHEYLDREFRSAHWKIGRFLSYFFPPTSGPPGVSPLQAVQTYFPLEELRKLLDEYGDSCASSPEESNAINEFKAQFAPGEA